MLRPEFKLESHGNIFWVKKLTSARYRQIKKDRALVKWLSKNGQRQKSGMNY